MRRNEVEYYQISKADFISFLGQCKRAMKKVGLADSVKYDEWSCKVGGESYWDKLKRTGQLFVSCADAGFGYSIDFDFGRVVYAAVWDNDLKEPRIFIEN